MTNHNSPAGWTSLDLPLLEPTPLLLTGHDEHGNGEIVPLDEPLFGPPLPSATEAKSMSTRAPNGPQALLELLVEEYGVRAVLNALADVCRESAQNGKPLPFDTTRRPGETIDVDDLQTAAAVMDCGLF